MFFCLLLVVCCSFLVTCCLWRVVCYLYLLLVLYYFLSLLVVCGPIWLSEIVTFKSWIVLWILWFYLRTDLITRHHSRGPKRDHVVVNSNIERSKRVRNFQIPKRSSQSLGRCKLFATRKHTINLHTYRQLTFTSHTFKVESECRVDNRSCVILPSSRFFDGSRCWQQISSLDRNNEELPQLICLRKHQTCPVDLDSLRTAWFSSPWQKYCTNQNKKKHTQLTCPVPKLYSILFSVQIHTIRHRSLTLTNDHVALCSWDNGLHVFEFVSFSNVPFDLLYSTNSSWAAKTTWNISQNLWVLSSLTTEPLFSQNVEL